MKYYRVSLIKKLGWWVLNETDPPIAKMYTIRKRIKQIIKNYPYWIYPTFCPDCDKDWIRSDGKGRYNEDWCRKCHYET